MNWLDSITVETTATPPLVIDQPLQDSGGTPNPLLSLLRPKFTIKTELGTKTYAPWGEPSVNVWPELQAAGAVALALLAWRFLR